MKYLKLYENFIQSDSEIHKLCKEYGIENYTINNGLVDVDGDVDLSGKGLTKLPVKFGNVSGIFNCQNNQLTSLEGAPQSVGGDRFNCNNNQLTSLEGCPKEVGNTFDCSINNIYRLDFLPNYKGALYISKTPFNRVWKLIENSIEMDYTLFDHFIENNIFRDPGYQGDDSGLPIIILDRLNDFLDMCKLTNVEEVEGYTCI